VCRVAGVPIRGRPPTEMIGEVARPHVLQHLVQDLRWGARQRSGGIRRPQRVPSAGLPRPWDRSVQGRRRPVRTGPRRSPRAVTTALDISSELGRTDHRRRPHGASSPMSRSVSKTGSRDATGVGDHPWWPHDGNP
jgi:hypothetical protein